ncbi:MAG: hypothetical protein AAF431_04225 [Pseudomonadota bacterium]
MSQPEFERAFEIVRNTLFEEPIEDPGDPIACRMHDAFGVLDGVGHNCLGCNFAEITNGIDHCLSKIVNTNARIEFDFTDYIWWLYLFVERAEVLFEVIELPASYRSRTFYPFVTIRRWANFLKHPNFFVFVHHPKYFFEGDASFDETQFDFVVDTNFVRDNYGAEAKSRRGSVRAKLQNKNDIAVLFPNIIELTEEFCHCAYTIFELVERNEVYREVLSNVSTLEEYFAIADQPE